MEHDNILYVGIRGTVLAIDPTTGRQLWATHLKGSTFVNVLVDGDRVYGATYGELFCLDRFTGEGLWDNPLTGFGRGLVCLATRASGAANLPTLAEEIQREEDASRTAAANTSHLP